MPRWMGGMRARVAAALLIILLIQFIGGEIIFRRMEEAQLQQGRAHYLADHLTVASKLIAEDAGAETMALMNRLWQHRLSIEILDKAPAVSSGTDMPELGFIRARISEAYPWLSAETLHLSRKGNSLEGALRLDDGTWISFRSEGYFESHSMILHYVFSVTLLVICVGLMALLFGRMIGRPLRQLVEAAEKVDRDEPVTVTVSGPSEVLQVAGAFEAMQARLLEHVRERVQSLAAMSHDLRTPLARLRLNASMVKDSELRSALEEDVSELEAFVASILDYLRGDEAEPEQHADIASIIMTIVDETRDAGGDAEYHGPDRLEIMTRPFKLKRIVRNLVENAVRHAGNARVELAIVGAEVAISVDDDGPGIAEEEMETVFEPFKRLDASRNRQTGGAGLGLAIAKRLATRFQGKITLQNRECGGLSSTLRFPLTRPDY